jgi:sugar lactone lactonase YvrE
MEPILWDAQKCHVGEGPVATGVDNELIYWVDILNNRVLWRNLTSDSAGEIATDEHVSFVLPRISGGLVLGTAHGPILWNEGGSTLLLPTRADADGSADPIPMRWNDAKVGPCGEIWMGTSAYGQESERVGLHRISPDGLSIERVLSGLKLSNGMDWSPDGTLFYLIDTVAFTLYCFDYKDGQISGQRVGMEFDSTLEQYPDGMCVDSEGCLWIAFWNGGCLRRYSPTFELLQEINFPVRFVSSCAFAGPELNTLIVTTATGDNGWHDEHELAGATFRIETEVKGKAPYVFAQ